MSLGPNTRFSMTLGACVVAVSAIVGATWRAANAVHELRAEVAGLRRDVAAIAHDRWTVGDMERWSYRLDIANRDRPLIVPDVRSAKADRGQ